MYIQSIQRAVDYIELNLHKTLRLHEIAKETGYSMFHFDRIFKYTLGESIIEYVKKRRLTEAASELISTNNRIIDIAIKYGFESQQAFTTAFTKYYNKSPRKYRINGKHLRLLEKKVLSIDIINRTKDMANRKPKIVIKDTFLVMGMEYFGANTNGEIPNLWSTFINHMKEIENVKNPGVTLGICDKVEDYDPELSEFSYMSCVEIEDYTKIPENMVVKKIPKQSYLVFTHRGSTENLEETYKYIYGNYFFKSEYEIADAPDFELYDERFNMNDSNSEMDIFIPIINTKKKSIGNKEDADYIR